MIGAKLELYYLIEVLPGLSNEHVYLRGGPYAARASLACKVVEMTSTK